MSPVVGASGCFELYRIERPSAYSRQDIRAHGTELSNFIKGLQDFIDVPNEEPEPDEQPAVESVCSAIAAEPSAVENVPEVPAEEPNRED